MWKSCTTQTGWEGQQRVHRTINFLKRATRDIAQCLGKKPAYGASGSLNLPGSLSQHLCYTPKSRLEARPEQNPSILVRLKSISKGDKGTFTCGGYWKNERGTHRERTWDRTVSQCSFCLTFKWTGNDLSTNDYKNMGLFSPSRHQHCKSVPLC